MNRNPRLLLALGLAANGLFWASVFGFAALRSDYSHLTDAVSELGVWGAPRMWFFNVLGYAAPGLLTALCGWGIGRSVAPKGVVTPALLALGGFGLLLAGVFPADLSNMRSLTTGMHIVGVYLALAWLPGLVVLAWLGRGRRVLATLCVVWLLLFVASFGLYAVIEQWPALIQRVRFAIFLSWFPLAATLLPRKPA
jgi:hypothetical membrane protein